MPDLQPSRGLRAAITLFSTAALLAGSLSAQGNDPQPASSRPEDGPKPAQADPTIITATRRDEKVFDVPYSAFVLEANRIQNERMSRTIPEALSQLPEVMGQKTAVGQASPFLRGFTGYNTLFLIDGIRLNNAAFRSGPNQYSATIDSFSARRVEVVLGPGSVLYGSDAVGGVVNVLTKRRESYEPGFHADGRLFFRWSEAESSFTERIEGSANVGDRFGIAAGVTFRDLGDLRAGPGTGVQPDTGFHELDFDVHADVKLNDQLHLSLVFQSVNQDDVPRTHSTKHAIPFEGTAVGTELRRDADQRRQLFYARLERADSTTSVDREQLTFYWHRQSENRDRITSATRRDISDFEVESPGMQLQVTRDTSAGVIVAGFEWQHDFVNSGRTNYQTGVAPKVDIQGPLGDNAGYDLVGLYVQDTITSGDFEFTPGVRFTYAKAFADQVDNPGVAGASPATPGNIIDVDDHWSAVTASFRALWHVDENVNVFGGISQAFRAPSLSDLTALDETSAAEFPSPGLDPEQYLQEEIGVKARGDGWSAQVSYWETQFFGAIITSPNGLFSGTTPIVVKDNIGDGYTHGAELQASVKVAEPLTAFGWGAWQEGYVDQTAFPGAPGTPFGTRAPVSRLLPLSGLVGLRYEGHENKWFVEAVARGMEKQDKLSFKDRSDTQRIPPGGTPGWLAVDLRAGLRIREDLRVTCALENLANENFRIHGSGINEPGVNFIVGVDFRF